MGALDGKTAVVTGAASGIGEALVLALVEGGANVVAADLNEVGLASIAERSGCATRAADVTSEADNAALMGAAIAEFGGLDLAFLNAGITGRDPGLQGEPITDLAAATQRYRQVQAVNVDGVVFGTTAAADAMTDGGAIVATASVAGLLPWVPDPTYTASKHAVVGWVRSVAPSLAAMGVSIDAICPGGVATPLVGLDAAAAEHNERLLAPAQVAEAAIGVALDDASGRAVSVVAHRDPVVLAHDFASVAGFDLA